MLLYVICLFHVSYDVCYMSLTLELDMLFVVICCMSVICYMLLFVVICYMSVICSMPVICLVQSPPQEAVVVFGYIEGPFLVSRTGCARECHAPCIEGPFLVSRTGHARERHAPS